MDSSNAIQKELKSLWAEIQEKSARARSEKRAHAENSIRRIRAELFETERGWVSLRDSLNIAIEGIHSLPSIQNAHLTLENFFAIKEE